MRKSTHLSTSPSPNASVPEETSSTTRAPKTRITLGLMQLNKSKNKFVSVRYARGGGSHT